MTIAGGSQAVHRHVSRILSSMYYDDNAQTILDTWSRSVQSHENDIVRIIDTVLQEASQPLQRCSANIPIALHYVRELASRETVFEIEHFLNGREYGIQAHVAGQDGVGICMYEHRNSDNIIINGCERWSERYEYGCYGIAGDTKYDYIELFGYEDYHNASRCAVDILEGQ